MSSDEDEAGLVYAEDEAEVVRAVVEFLGSSTYDQKRVLVAEHPELLTAKADAILVRVVELHRTHGSEVDAAVTESWREFLVDVRRENFAYALAQSVINRIFVETPDNPAEWNAYLRGVAARESSLRTPEGDKALAKFIATLRADGVPTSLSAAFEGLRSLVKQ